MKIKTLIAALLIGLGSGVWAQIVTSSSTDRKELLSYCYSRQVAELKIERARVNEQERQLEHLKESLRKELRRLNNDLINMHERRIGYLRRLLDDSNINPNSNSFMQKYDRLVLEDLSTEVPSHKEEQCAMRCLERKDALSSPIQQKHFEACSAECFPISASIQRARACNSVFTNLH